MLFQALRRSGKEEHVTGASDATDTIERSSKAGHAVSRASAIQNFAEQQKLSKVVMEYERARLVAEAAMSFRSADGTLPVVFKSRSPRLPSGGPPSQGSCGTNSCGAPCQMRSWKQFYWGTKDQSDLFGDTK